MIPEISTYDDVLAELTRRRIDLGDIAKLCGASRQYTRYIVIQRFAGIVPGPGTKGARILKAVDAALQQHRSAQLSESLGE